MEGWKVGRLEGWKVRRLEGWKVRRLEGWKVGRVGWKYGRVERRLEGEKVGRLKGFCHFSFFQTVLEKVGRLERWNSCIFPPILAQFDRAERRRREARRE